MIYYRLLVQKHCASPSIRNICVFVWIPSDTYLLEVKMLKKTKNFSKKQIAYPESVGLFSTTVLREEG